MATSQIILHAQEVRERLRHPPNAVADSGIDLRRPKKGFLEQKPGTKRMTIAVTIEEVRPPPNKKLTFNSVLRAVSAHYAVSVCDIKGPSRRQIFVIPRKVVVYLAWKHLGRSIAWIGRSLGGRDHSTALHSKRRIQELLARNDERTVASIDFIEYCLNAGYFDEEHHTPIPGERESRLYQQAWEREESLRQQRVRGLAEGCGVALKETEAA